MENWSGGFRDARWILNRRPEFRIRRDAGMRFQCSGDRLCLKSFSRVKGQNYSVQVIRMFMIHSWSVVGRRGGRRRSERKSPIFVARISHLASSISIPL